MPGPLLRKYIAYARTYCHPVLGEKAPNPTLLPNPNPNPTLLPNPTHLTLSLTLTT